MSQDSLSAWYADFFTELPNAFWRAAVPPAATAAEVDFIVRVSGLGPGARVLTCHAAAAGTPWNSPDVAAR